YIELYLESNAVSSGIYTLDSLITPKAKYYVTGTEFVSKSGTAAITLHNQGSNEISGSFDFNAGVLGTGTISHTLQSGSFSVTYTD
ncbi:MAG: hypothetical protein KJ607_12765, partial [Bacteroidetes bacterium]|nr:hypothetical protein [Bacteroidota bacterium]